MRFWTLTSYSTNESLAPTLKNTARTYYKYFDEPKAQRIRPLTCTSTFSPVVVWILIERMLAGVWQKWPNSTLRNTTGLECENKDSCSKLGYRQHVLVGPFETLELAVSNFLWYLALKSRRDYKEQRRSMLFSSSLIYNFNIFWKGQSR